MKTIKNGRDRQIESLYKILQTSNINESYKKKVFKQLKQLCEEATKEKKKERRRIGKGVYIMYNNSEDRMYIGKSTDLHERINKHITLMRNKTHDNPYMQEHYNRAETEFEYLLIPLKKDIGKIEMALINYCMDNGIKLYNRIVTRMEEDEYNIIVKEMKGEGEGALFSLLTEGRLAQIFLPFRTRQPIGTSKKDVSKVLND